ARASVVGTVPQGPRASCGYQQRTRWWSFETSQGLTRSTGFWSEPETQGCGTRACPGRGGPDRLGDGLVRWRRDSSLGRLKVGSEENDLPGSGTGQRDVLYSRWQASFRGAWWRRYSAHPNRLCSN